MYTFYNRTSDWVCGAISFQLTLLMMECVAAPRKTRSLLYCSVAACVLLESNADLILEGKRWLAEDIYY